MLFGVRIAVVVLAGGLALTHPWATSPDPALKAALLSFAAATLLYLLLDLLWARLLRGNMGDQPDIASTWGPLVGLIVTTAGVVLGLLSAFDNRGSHLTDALKVGTLSLVATVILGMVLFGMVVSAPPKGGAAVAFRALVFNLTLSSLGLGVLSIGWALFYR